MRSTEIRPRQDKGPHIISLLIVMGLWTALGGCTTPPPPPATSERMISLERIARRHGLRLIWEPVSQRAILKQGSRWLVVSPALEFAFLSNKKVPLITPPVQTGSDIMVSQNFYQHHIRPFFTAPVPALPVKVATTVTPPPAPSPTLPVAPRELEEARFTPENEQELPAISPPSPVTPSGKRLPRNYTVVIDPGHGGRDVGATRQGIHEKDIVLTVAKLLAELVKKAGGHPYLTRSQDVFISLAQRVRLAHRAKAACFISIHVNAARSVKAHGFEIWISRHGKRRRLQHSLRLARYIRRAARDLPFKDRGIHRSNFYVIKNNKLPAVLVECGFISNTTDRQRLQDLDTLRQIARTIFQGLLQYARQTHGKSRYLTQKRS